MYLTIIKKATPFFYTDEEKLTYAKNLAKRGRYLSQLENRQIVHSMICEMAGGCKREQEKLLYKVLNGKADSIMIQSAHSLKRDVLDEFGYEKIQELKIDSIYDEIVENGVTLRFKANLAPTKSVCKKKVCISDANERIDWVKTKIEDSGATVFSVEEVESEFIRLSHRYDKKESFYKGYSYVGTLKILDKNTFLDAVWNGVGKGKSYGTGLIILAK